VPPLTARRGENASTLDRNRCRGRPPAGSVGRSSRRVASAPRWATPVGCGWQPSRMARQGGHNHQPGRPSGWWRVGSPANINRHRPHCRRGGSVLPGASPELGSTRGCSASSTTG
jgi:hypothetical protein